VAIQGPEVPQRGVPRDIFLALPMTESLDSRRLDIVMGYQRGLRK